MTSDLQESTSISAACQRRSSPFALKELPRSGVIQELRFPPSTILQEGIIALWQWEQFAPFPDSFSTDYLEKPAKITNGNHMIAGSLKISHKCEQVVPRSLSHNMKVVVQHFPTTGSSLQVIKHPFHGHQIPDHH